MQKNINDDEDDSTSVNLSTYSYNILFISYSKQYIVNYTSLIMIKLIITSTNKYH